MLWAEPEFCQQYGDATAPFGRKEILDIKEYLQYEQPDREKLLDQSLVVLNSCLTGRTRSHGGQREDLAWTLLDEGAEVVIASPLPVYESMGTRLGVGLYDPELAPGSRCLGETFLHLRCLIERRYRGRHIWPAWSLLAYHGNPYTRLPHVGQPARNSSEE
ncbi:unnamed protein product [marine sediment metagenome]|uniref:Uncharacterized protein n=1 Tax=marine sediment metagenome TaxID=412755 RepID=X0T5M4_9ZZZZ